MVMVYQSLIDAV